ncbi:MAG: SET domain-containing protein [Bdellovibrionales bacterium]|nr:SET domain-containing protein [Bdellovibrionales bacterium]
MMHPDTTFHEVNDIVGLGVFATKAIPRGTMTYVFDKLEIVVTKDEFEKLDENYQPLVQKYSFLDSSGNRIVSWDHGKYVNHCCFPNTLNTGYGFEIAIRDIAEGEQLTDDYGMFNLRKELTVCCEKENCRQKVTCNDWDELTEVWDREVKRALKLYQSVRQPLECLMSPEAREELYRYLGTGEDYRSVECNRWHENRT